jgi:hypothetical protein
MMNKLTGGAWGRVPMRLLENAALSLPLLAVLFLPLALGARWLYPWAQPEAVASSALLQHQQVYLNLPLFLLRSAVLFLFAISMAYMLSGRSPQKETLSGPGLLGYGLLVTFVYIDWLMTMQPRWYSTIFGMLIICGQGVSAYAFLIVALVLLSATPPLSQRISTKVLHDLGKLLQAFVLLWAYMAFSQLLIIWAGNLPREILWYTPRLQTSWRWLGVLLLLGHFALPFFLLLFRDLKRRPRPLAVLAGWVLLMRLCDQLWLVEPDFQPQGFRLHVLDVWIPISLGGFWVAYYCWLLRHRPLLEGELS